MLQFMDGLLEPQAPGLAGAHFAPCRISRRCAEGKSWHVPFHAAAQLSPLRVSVLHHSAVLQPALRGVGSAHTAFCNNGTHQHFSCAKKVLVKWGCSKRRSVEYSLHRTGKTTPCSVQRETKSFLGRKPLRRRLFLQKWPYASNSYSIRQ